MPGRRVADGEFSSAGPGVLSAAEIERKLADDEACHVANWYPHEIIPQLPDFKPD